MNNFQRSLALVGALLVASVPALAQDSAEGMSAGDVIKKLQAPKKTRSIGVGTGGGITKEQKGEMDDLLSRKIGLKERKEIAVIEQKAALPKLDFPIYFAYNSSEISPESYATLKILGEALSSETLKVSNFLVKGHTDARGDGGYNQRLSEARATSVVDYLAEHFSIDSQRLKAIGYGETEIKNTDDPESGDNRRVEMVNLTY